MNLYIDSGVRACGVALFSAGRLIAAGFPTGLKLEKRGKGTGSLGERVGDTSHADGRASTWTAMATAVEDWVNGYREIGSIHLYSVTIELPQVRRREHQRAAKKGTDPNDLIQLAAVVGAICDRFSDGYVGVTVRVVLPEEWKGTVPKEIQHPRALARLSAGELAVIPKMAASRLHNVIDAIAMGLVDASRL